MDTVKDKKFTINHIERIVKHHYSCSEDLHNKTRKREIVTARHIVMTIASKLCSGVPKYKFPAYFGQDHSTGLHAEKQVSNLCETDKNYRIEYHKVFNSCLSQKQETEQLRSMYDNCIQY